MENILRQQTSTGIWREATFERGKLKCFNQQTCSALIILLTSNTITKLCFVCKFSLWMYLIVTSPLCYAKVWRRKLSVCVTRLDEKYKQWLEWSWSPLVQQNKKQICKVFHSSVDTYHLIWTACISSPQGHPLLQQPKDSCIGRMEYCKQSDISKYNCVPSKVLHGG